MDKRGISAIVATVLVILITVAGIGIIWVGILPMISENIAFESLEGRVSVVSTGGYTVYDADREIAMVQVKRDVDDGVMDRIVVSFIIDGNSVSSNVVAPGSGQSKTYSFDLSGYGEPDSVGVAPIFVSGNSEKVGSEISNVKIKRDVINEVEGVVYEIGVDSFGDVPTDGLISIWTFSGDADDGWGDNDGDLVNDANVNDGVLVLDGTGDWVNVTNMGMKLPTNEITANVWVKVSSVRARNAFSLYPDDSSNRVSFHVFYAAASNTYWDFGDITSGGRVNYDTDLSALGSWQFYSVVSSSSGGYMEIYRNGVREASSANAEAFVSKEGDFIIGGTFFFGGSIDNVMIYDRVLNEEEINTVYEAQRK